MAIKNFTTSDGSIPVTLAKIARQVLQPPGDQAQVGRRDDATAGQDGQPLGHADIRLAPGDLFDIPGIHHPGTQPRLVQTWSTARP